MNGLIGPSPHLPHNSLPPGSGLGTFSAIAQSPYTDARYLKAFTSCGNLSNFCSMSVNLLLCMILMFVTFIVICLLSYFIISFDEIVLES